MRTPPYVRLLGASEKGLEVLSKGTLFNLLIKPSQIKELSDDAAKVFKAECRATDIYTLSLKSPVEAGLEYKRKFLKSEDLL